MVRGRYTRIFESYTKMIESFVMESLTAQLPGFAMEEFLAMLQAREGQLDGDVFELLYSLGDFAVFKDLILSYKPENQLDFSSGLTVTPVSEGDAMLVSPARAGGGASLA
jgi:ADP-ribosylation factor 2-binding protein